MQRWQAEVNRSDNKSGKYYKFVANTDLSDYDASWISIGNYTTSSIMFNGNFDGNGHTIYNLYINRNA